MVAVVKSSIEREDILSLKNLKSRASIFPVKVYFVSWVVNFVGEICTDGMTNVLILEQFCNAYAPNVVTEDGIVNVPAIPEQPEKAKLPIVVTDDGIFRLVKPVHLKKAYVPTDLTVEGMS